MQSFLIKNNKMKKIISILLIVLVSNIFLDNTQFKESIILQSTGNFIIEGNKYANEIVEIIYGIEKKIIEYIFKKNDEIINTIKDKAFPYFNNTCTKKSISEIKSDIKKYFLEIIKEIRNNIEKYPKLFEDEKKKYINHINEIKFSNSTIQKDFIKLINDFSKEYDSWIENIKKDINEFLHFNEKNTIDEFFDDLERDSKKFHNKNEIKNKFFREIGSINYEKYKVRRDLIDKFRKIRSFFEEFKFVYGVVEQDLERYISRWDLDEKYEIIIYIRYIEPEKIIEILKYTVETIKNIYKRKEINELINLFNRLINIPKEYISNELINILQDFVKDILSGDYFINYDFEKIYKKINEILKWGISYFKTIKTKEEFYKEFQKYLPDIREAIKTFNIHQYISFKENYVKKSISIFYDYIRLIVYTIGYSFQKFNSS